MNPSTRQKGKFKIVCYLGGLLNGRANSLGNELLDEILELAGTLLSHNLEDLLADVLDLGRRGVVSLPQAVLTLLSESNAEETKLVTVSGGDIEMRVNQRLPLLDQGAHLVGGKVHSVELSLGSAAFDIQNLQLELSVESILILVQVSEVGLNDAALQRLRSMSKITRHLIQPRLLSGYHALQPVDASVR